MQILQLYPVTTIANKGKSHGNNPVLLKYQYTTAKNIK